MPGRSVLSCRHFIETCFWPGQNVPSCPQPCSEWGEGNVLVVRLILFALTAGLLCKPPARARRDSRRLATARWEVPY